MTILKWLRLLYGRLSLILLLSLVSISTVGCSQLGALSFLTGGGPNVAANTQIGKENNQTLGLSNKTTNAPSVSLRPKARVDNIDQSVTTKQELPTWVWIVFLVLFVAGWVTDTPATYIKRLRGKDA